MSQDLALLQTDTEGVNRDDMRPTSTDLKQGVVRQLEAVDKVPEKAEERLQACLQMVSLGLDLGVGDGEMYRTCSLRPQVVPLAPSGDPKVQKLRQDMAETFLREESAYPHDLSQNADSAKLLQEREKFVVFETIDTVNRINPSNVAGYQRALSELYSEGYNTGTAMVEAAKA